MAKGYTKGEAAFMARDLMDFSLQGKAPIVRFLVQTVPFLNARLQGLYKLGRADTSGEKYDDVGINKRFANIAVSVAMLSLALMLTQQDDDDWKRREDWDRDAYWWIKIGGTAFRFPKPFELGSIGTLAERTWELMFNKEMTPRRYTERLGQMLTQTFAMNPTPQFAKPLIDIYANKDSFSGRDIETQVMRAARPQDRANESTTLFARAAGSVLGAMTPGHNELSPVQVDYLVGAYFGGLGTTHTGITDILTRPFTDKGARPNWTLKTWTAGFLDDLPANQSRYVQLFYDRAKQVGESFNSYQQAMKRGDRQAALEIMAEDQKLIAQHTAVDGIKRKLSDLAQLMRQAEASRQLDGPGKRKLLDGLAQKRDALAQKAMDVLPAN